MSELGYKWEFGRISYVFPFIIKNYIKHLKYA